MKKILLFAMVLLSSLALQAKDELTLETGSLTELMNKENRVLFNVDYSKAKIPYDGETYNLNGYLKKRGDDFVADWKADSQHAFQYLPVRYNQKNKKGAKALETESGAHDILCTVQLTDIDFGYSGGAFIPFSGAKEGGCRISGKLVFTDKNKKQIAVIPFSKVKGMGHGSETVRLGMSYFELMNQLGDLIKKENKKK